MSSKGTVVSVNVSREKGTVKEPVSEVRVDENGIVNDAHAGPWHRQVSILAMEDVELFSKEMGRAMQPGEFAENLSIRGIDLSRAAVLDRFQIGRVGLEVTQIGKECHGQACTIFRQTGKCVMPKKGLFCRVISTGQIRPQDTVEYLSKQLRLLVITLSDRAFAGQYTDRSGPKVRQILETHFADTRWHFHIDNVLLDDDANKLRQTLQAAVNENIDAVFTLGSTGIGPRDIAPETVSSLGGRAIPGVMENIRLKFGRDKPSALLSRSVAAVVGRTQLYTLPGSVRAVEEYLGEILKTLEHAVFMMHGMDMH